MNHDGEALAVPPPAREEVGIETVIEISQIRVQGGLDVYARPTHGLSTNQIRARILETTD